MEYIGFQTFIQYILKVHFHPTYGKVAKRVGGRRSHKFWPSKKVVSSPKKACGPVNFFQRHVVPLFVVKKWIDLQWSTLSASTQMTPDMSTCHNSHHSTTTNTQRERTVGRHKGLTAVRTLGGRAGGELARRLGGGAVRERMRLMFIMAPTKHNLS